MQRSVFNIFDELIFVLPMADMSGFSVLPQNYQPTFDSNDYGESMTIEKV